MPPAWGTWSLDAVAVRPGGDVWLSGPLYYATGSTLLRWDGTQWTRPSPAALPAAPRLNAITFGSPDDGWVVGDRATLLRYRPLRPGVYLPSIRR